jgi:hypothetical protein
MGAPVQRIVKAADFQIASTKEIPGLPAAKGLLWIASDGNQGLQPDTVWFLVTRILRKRQGDGTPQYRHIHGMAYFTPRMIAAMPQTTLLVLFWFGGAREDGDQEMKALLGMLSAAWPQYVASVQGVQLHLVDKENTLSDLRFAGPPRPLPKILYERSPARRQDEIIPSTQDENATLRAFLCTSRLSLFLSDITAQRDRGNWPRRAGSGHKRRMSSVTRKCSVLGIDRHDSTQCLAAPTRNEITLP